MTNHGFRKADKHRRLNSHLPCAEKRGHSPIAANLVKGYMTMLKGAAALAGSTKARDEMIAIRVLLRSLQIQPIGVPGGTQLGVPPNRGQVIDRSCPVDPGESTRDSIRSGLSRVVMSQLTLSSALNRVTRSFCAFAQ
jgi:hypothetical protein